MTTQKNYTDNLNRRIITADMLADSLYSVNKRAKNCRDKERECRRIRYDAYDNASKYASKKEAYYRIKDELLSLLSPTCIHRVRHERICTIDRDEDDGEKFDEMTYVGIDSGDIRKIYFTKEG